MVPEVGDEFRQFRILAKIGERGMGEVFRARDTKLNRDVALKFLSLHTSSSGHWIVGLPYCAAPVITRRLGSGRHSPEE